jgi:hypothetical protein
MACIQEPRNGLLPKRGHFIAASPTLGLTEACNVWGIVQVEMLSPPPCCYPQRKSLSTGQQVRVSALALVHLSASKQFTQHSDLIFELSNECFL